MKLIAFLLVSVWSFTACSGPSTSTKTPPAKKVEANKEAPKNKVLEALDKKPEDCDEKAKKVVEIKPESISLTGNTGCSLDEAKP